MRKELVSIGDDYWIEDEQGRQAFRVDGKVLRLQKTFVLEDPEGAEVATIRSVTGADTVAVAADVTTQEGRDAILAACPDPDILINNAGGPPSGDFRNWDRGDWIKALDANMLAPIELMKSTIDGMIAQVRPDPGRRLWTASQRANCKTVHIDSILVLASKLLSRLQNNPR